MNKKVFSLILIAPFKELKLKFHNIIFIELNKILIAPFKELKL